MGKKSVMGALLWQSYSWQRHPSVLKVVNWKVSKMILMLEEGDYTFYIVKIAYAYSLKQAKCFLITYPGFLGGSKEKIS